MHNQGFRHIHVLNHPQQLGIQLPTNLVAPTGACINLTPLVNALAKLDESAMILQVPMRVAELDALSGLTFLLLRLPLPSLLCIKLISTALAAPTNHSAQSDLLLSVFKLDPLNSPTGHLCHRTTVIQTMRADPYPND